MTRTLLILLPAFSLLAQTAEKSNSEVKFDTAQARVVFATEQPHQPSPLHEHKLNRVMVYLDSGEMIETNAAGRRRTIDFKAGEVRWSPATGPHISEYNADHPVRIVEVEIKNMPASAPPANPLDPVKVDPKHYALILENNQVRVLRVRFGPHESSARHEHAMNHVVVYLTDQARGKAGEVHLDGPTTHSEQNTLDQAVERIAIDLK